MGRFRSRDRSRDDKTRAWRHCRHCARRLESCVGLAGVQSLVWAIGTKCRRIPIDRKFERPARHDGTLFREVQAGRARGHDGSTQAARAYGRIVIGRGGIKPEFAAYFAACTHSARMYEAFHMDFAVSHRTARVKSVTIGPYGPAVAHVSLPLARDFTGR